MIEVKNNKIIKIFFILNLFFIFFVSSAFSITYTSSEGFTLESWYYSDSSDVIKLESKYGRKVGSISNSLTFDWEEFNQDNNYNKGIVFLPDEEGKLFIIKDYQYSSSSSIPITFQDRYSKSDLNGENKCIVDLSSEGLEYMLKLKSNLLYYKIGSKKFDFSALNETLKNKYYYMKTNVIYELINNSGITINYSNDIVYISPDGVNLNIPFTESCENCRVKVTAKPIDLKCDFSKDNKLDDSEINNVNIYIPYNILNPEDNLIIDSNGNTEANDGIKTKVVKKEDGSFVFKKHGVEEVVLTLDVEKKKSIKVNGELKDILLEDIVLFGHSVENYKNKEQIEKFTNDAMSSMNKFNINKTIISNSENTIIKIKLDNNTNVGKYTIYQVIPKSFANSIDKLNIEGDYFIKDKDPVIGWNLGGESNQISYTLPGENNGGLTIITEDAILYNNGNLIVNYRENKCNNDEVTLFELEDLYDSNIFKVSSDKFYKVCVATEKWNLKNETTGLNILNFSNSNLYNKIGENKVYISGDNLIFDMKIEKDAGENYSCVGSFNESTGLFGDCDFNENNRIWIKVDEKPDLETTLSYPYLSHTVEVTLTSNTDGATIYYKNESENEIEYTVPFVVTCPNKWACSKTIEFWSEKDGEEEIHKSETIELLPQGSACQADCTARPFPDRILEGCRNLNGCKFLSINNDDGESVANKCHLAIGDSWVKFNETTDVKCPNGPFRKTTFNLQKLFVTSNKCLNLDFEKYPVIIDGQMVNMNIITCQ